ncbi:lipoprotein insertase outer membrane protein LolB [Paludibacterium yongneupense]|uniref:lipoprotein insertase outer membrane protein LolB n=1 Tax=Paludibacterium yongneupense TaxID=400061 RepID=UPI00040AFD82|nr:lipoprotein insertase outer membrane protein LolB [Paludibacterium yongneupense]
MRFGRLALALTASIALGACASHDAPFAPQAASQSRLDAPFSASGRLAVRYDGRGELANFDWIHSAARDELSINTPLGNTVARLVRDSGGVELTQGEDRWRAADVEALSRQRLGWELPLSGLAWWIRGYTAPGLPASVDAEGLLHQAGWTIRFVSDADAPSVYPSRVELSRGDLSIRLLTSTWRP